MKMTNYNLENIYFILERAFGKVVNKFMISYSRRKAHRYRKEVVSRKGKRVMTRQIKKEIKEYSMQRFGTSAYWPYLALYTEIRGGYVKGWIPHDYIRYILLPKINPQFSCEISEHKTFDHRIFGEFSIKPLFVFISGMFLNAAFEVVEISKVKKFLSGYDDTIVLKEERGTQGMQISIVHSSGFEPEKLRKDVNYIIQPYVKQYKALNDLYPDSVNTLRVTTLLKTDGSVDIKFVVLRFGVDGSKVDNLSAGGQYIYFDNTGKPSNYAYDVLGFNLGGRHKNSGYLFSDLQIPMFQKVLEECKTAHKKYPYVRLIGWDVCINDSGEPKLLEWNADDPGVWYFEPLFGPFWPDDEDLN